MTVVTEIVHFRKGISKIVKLAITRVSSSPCQFLSQLCFAIPAILEEKKTQASVIDKIQGKPNTQL
jgi:hypothetical protein